MEKIIVPLQNGILGERRKIARMEEGADKTAAQGALAEFRKSDERARKHLFFLQIWKKHGRETAVKYARRKNGEYLDNDLAKVLEDMDNLEYKRERDRESTKERSNVQVKRFRGDSRAGPSEGYRGGYVQRGRGGYFRGGKQTATKKERKCYLCGATDHFVRNCPKNTHKG